MAIGAFPLIKLGALALRQISKPFASHLKTRAKSSHFFRTKICIPTGQLYHTCEVHIKARMLNLGKPSEVVKLNEQAAIDLGSELIGEMTMFMVAATTVIFEYARQSRKNADEKAAYEARLQGIEARNNDLEVRNITLESRFLTAEERINYLQQELDQALVKLKK